MEKTTSLFDDAPDGLVDALAASMFTRDIPPQGPLSLRQAAAEMKFNGELELEAEELEALEAELAEFLEERAGLVAEAEEVLEALYELEPPTMDLDWEAGVPEWYRSEWGELLRFPWAERLPWAVSQARRYLSSR